MTTRWFCRSCWQSSELFFAIDDNEAIAEARKQHARMMRPGGLGCSPVEIVLYKPVTIKKDPESVPSFDFENQPNLL